MKGATPFQLHMLALTWLELEPRYKMADVWPQLDRVDVSQAPFVFTAGRGIHGPRTNSRGGAATRAGSPINRQCNTRCRWRTPWTCRMLRLDS